MKQSVGVYIATANRPHLFKRAIFSVLGQTVKPQQISVCVNGDSAHFCEYENIIAGINDNYSYEIKVNFYEGNLSPGKAKKNALDKLSTLYATGLDDDDIFLPERLELFLNNIMDDDVVLFSNQILLLPSKSILVQRPQNITLKMLSNRNHIGNQVFAKTEVLTKINYSDVPVIDDYDFVIRILGAGFNVKNVENFTYVWDKSNSLPRVTNSHSILFRDTYIKLGKEYKYNYGIDFDKFEFGRFDYIGAKFYISDIKELNFWKYGFAKYFKQKIKQITLSFKK